MAEDAVLECRGLSKRFSGFYAVSEVSLSVRRGTIHALIGPNGAGKTTVFNLLTRFMDPTSGTVHLMGQDITKVPPARAARMGMVRSFQISAVFRSMTALENVRLAVQRRRYRNSMSFWRSREVLRQFDDEAIATLEGVGLADLADVSADQMSYGNRRILELAVTIAMDPSVILLDEPMAGVGQEEISKLADLISGLSGTRTVLIVEHNLSVVASISDEVTVLARGQVLAQGRYAEVSTNPDVIESYIGSTLE